MTARRKRYRHTIIAAAVLLLPVALVLVGNAFLRYAVTTQLSALDAGDVRISSASMGLFCHTVREIAWTDPANGDGPWFTIEKAVLDLPLWHVLAGKWTPRVILARGARVRVDEADRTGVADALHAAFSRRLPCQTLYVQIDQVVVSGQALTGHTFVLQAHRAADRLDVVVRPRHARQNVAGEPPSWFAGCRLDYSDRQGTAVVRAFDVAVRTDAMKGVSVGSIDVGRLDGRAQCDVDGNLRFSESEILDSTLKLDARHLKLKYPGFPVRLEGGSSRAEYENGHLELAGQRLRVADGFVNFRARLDLEKENWEGTVVAKADNLSLIHLLPDHTLPVRSQGMLSLDGQAALRGIPGGLRVEAKGQGKVANAKIQDIDANRLDVQLLVTDCEWRRGAAPRYGGHVRIALESRSIEAAQLFSLPPLQPYKPTPLPSGRLFAEGSLTVPLASVTDPGTYQLAARLESKDTQWRDLDLSHASARLTYEEGTLAVQEAEFQFGEGGRVTARGDFGLIPHGRIRLDGQLREVALSAIVPRVPDAPESPPALLSADWHATVGLDQWARIDQWQGSGTVTLSPVALDAATVTETRASIRVAHGRLEIVEARMHLEDARIQGRGSITLTEPYPFRARAEAREFPIASALRVAPWPITRPIQGVLNGTTRIEGTLRPWNYVCRGEALESSVSVADQMVNVPSLRWLLTPEKFEISDATLDVAGGRIRATAHVPFNDQLDVRMEGRFEAMDFAEVLERMEPPFSVSPTSAAGDFRFSGRTWQELLGHVSFNAPSLDTPYVAMRSVRGQIDYNRGGLQLRAEADTLGGAVQLRATGQLDTSSMIVDDILGTLSWRDVVLRDAVHRLIPRTSIPSLRAQASGRADFSFPSRERSPELEGEFTIGNVAYGDAAIARQIAGRVVLDEQSLQVRQLEGRIGNGSLRADADVPLRDPRDATFQVRLNRVPLDTLQPWLPADWAGVRGSVNGQARGRAGDVWRGTGTASISRGRAKGLSANQVRSTFRWSISPDSAAVTAQGTVRGTQIARGDLRGDWTMAWNRRLALQAELHARQIDMQSLSRWIPNLNDTLRGRLQGQVAVQSRNAGSLSDWNGHFELKVRDSNIFVMPVIRATAATLGVAAPRTLSVSQIVARGRLRRGNVILERMTMQDPDVQVWLDGTLSRFGTLDLNVTADAPSAYAVGVVTGLLRPTDLLQRRLLFLHVGGNVRRPVVRPRTDEFLQQELIRFFLPVVTP